MFELLILFSFSFGFFLHLPFVVHFCRQVGELRTGSEQLFNRLSIGQLRWFSPELFGDQFDGFLEVRLNFDPLLDLLYPMHDGGMVAVEFVGDHR